MARLYLNVTDQHIIISLAEASNSIQMLTASEDLRASVASGHFHVNVPGYRGNLHTSWENLVYLGVESKK